MDYYFQNVHKPMKNNLDMYFYWSYLLNIWFKFENHVTLQCHRTIEIKNMNTIKKINKGFSSENMSNSP